MLQVEVKNQVWGWIVMDVMIQLVKCEEMKLGLMCSVMVTKGDGNDRSMVVSSSSSSKSENSSEPMTGSSGSS